MKKKETIKNKNWTYVGEVNNGQPHGKGKRSWGDKITKYEGQFLNGKEHGYGKLKINNGEVDFYEGNFKKGCFHGKGTYYENYRNKNSYEAKHVGIWKNGEPKEGTTLEKPHTSEGKDWVKYQGRWVSTIKTDWGLPMKQGRGERIYNDGTKLVGTFYNDEFNKGEGTINFGNSKYVGQIKVIDGSTNYGPHGKGIDKFKNGDVYEGVFKNGRLDVATNFKISTKDLTWLYKGKLSQSGAPVAEGKGAMKIFKNTKPKWYSYEEGTFKNHALNGKGIRINYHDKKLTRPKSIYKGEFNMGNMDGRALYWQYPCDWYHEGRFSKNNYIDDVNKTKKLSKKVLNLIKFARNLEKK